VAAILRRDGAAGRRSAADDRVRRRLARQDQPVDRCAGQQVDGGIGQQRLPPAQRGVEHTAERPEHRRGEPADDGEQRDRLPRPWPGDLDDGDRGGRAERQRRGNAHQRPTGQIAHRPLGSGKAGERQRIDQRAQRHQPARAGAVDDPADPRRQEGTDAEHHGDAAEHQLGRETERRLQLAAQHRGHQVGGAPADDLGEAEAADRAGDRPRGGRQDHAAQLKRLLLARDRATAGPLRWQHRRRAR